MKDKLIAILLVLAISFGACTIRVVSAQSPEQFVVNFLEGNFGFDVTYVYLGSERRLAFYEDCALVVIRTNEHVKNFQFTNTHEKQFRWGKTALQVAFSDAEVFMVFIWEDLDWDGLPDIIGGGGLTGGNGYYEVGGPGIGGRTSTAFPNDYWIHAENFVKITGAPPTISDVHQDVEDPKPDESVTVTATVIDESNVRCAWLIYTVNGEEETVVLMAQYGDAFTATIPGQYDGVRTEYYVFAVNNEGNGVFSLTYDYTVTKPSSQISCNLSSSKVTYVITPSVTISGSITPAHPDVSVTIHYSIDGDSWDTLTTVTSDSEL